MLFSITASIFILLQNDRLLLRPTRNFVTAIKVTKKFAVFYLYLLCKYLVKDERKGRLKFKVKASRNVNVGGWVGCRTPLLLAYATCFLLPWFQY